MNNPHIFANIVLLLLSRLYFSMFSTSTQRKHWTFAGEDDVSEAKKRVQDRQISRLYVVGSNDTTAPVIDRIFADSAAARMGSSMVNIGQGENEFRFSLRRTINTSPA